MVHRLAVLLIHFACTCNINNPVKQFSLRLSDLRDAPVVRRSAVLFFCALGDAYVTITVPYASQLSAFFRGKNVHETLAPNTHRQSVKQWP